MPGSLRLAATTALTAAALPAIAADDELLILDWSGYEEEPYWQHYAEQHGEMPTYTFFGDEEEAFQKLRSGFRAGVSHPCPQSVEKWRQAGLIEPWDTSQIPSYATVAEAFKTDPVFVQDGDVYFIPADLGATAIDKVRETITRLKAAGVAVIIISHRLEDIFAIGDRFVVMKQGRLVGSRAVGDTANAEIVEMIVTGRDPRLSGVPA